MMKLADYGHAAPRRENLKNAPWGREEKEMQGTLAMTSDTHADANYTEVSVAYHTTPDNKPLVGRFITAAREQGIDVTEWPTTDWSDAYEGCYQVREGQEQDLIAYAEWYISGTTDGPPEDGLWPLSVWVGTEQVDPSRCA